VNAGAQRAAAEARQSGISGTNLFISSRAALRTRAVVVVRPVGTI